MRTCSVLVGGALPVALLGAAIIATSCTSSGRYVGPRPYRPYPHANPALPVPRVPVPPVPHPAHASDARLKHETGSYERGLDALENIRTVRFRYRGDNPLGLDPAPEHIGVIAQDLESAVPEAVGRDGSGYRMVDPDPVLWTAVNAIRELRRENRELRGRLEELEAAKGR